MIEREDINGMIFIAQTTFFVYKNDEDLKADKPALLTSSQTEFNYIKNHQIIGVVDVSE